MPEQLIADIFARWHAHDPHLYDDFLKAFDAYTFQVTAAVAAADNDQILRFAGRAQIVQKILQLASDIPALRPQQPSRAPTLAP